MNSNHDLDRCDYDTAAITDYDPRFEASKKSALFLHILGIVASIVGTCWMFNFERGDPTLMTYFLGFPLWFSGATIIYTIMTIIGIVHICKWDEFPLTARANRKGEK